MMGKAAKVKRCASILAVAGSSGCTREMAAFTYCRVWNVSTSQRKNRSTSAEPRLVMERTCSSPGTLFTASSMGRVTVTIIWSMGITPLSTPISTRGKSVEGNTDTGMVKARYAPSRARVRMRKMTGRECRATQCSEVGRFTLLLRVGYFSLGAGFSPDSFGDSPLASTLILVLSGKPYAPLATTLSPAVTPSTICTSASWRMPSFTAFW